MRGSDSILVDDVDVEEACTACAGAKAYFVVSLLLLCFGILGALGIFCMLLGK